MVSGGRRVLRRWFEEGHATGRNPLLKLLTQNMLSILYYIWLAVICTVMLILSLVALALTYPFEKSRRLVHEMSRYLSLSFLLPFPSRVEGLENVDRRGRYVIVLNHQAMVDIGALYHVPLNFRWVSKREVFRIPFFGQYLWVHGDICIDRGHAAMAMEQLLRKGKLWLSRGVSVAIFPEGTRSKDGEMHRFKAGAFTLAKEAGVAILPVVLDGTQRVIGRNRLFNWRNRVTVKVLPPVPAAEVAATETHALMCEVHDRMAGALRELREGNGC